MTDAASTDRDTGEYCLEVAQRASAAAVELANLSSGVKIAWLNTVADMLPENADRLIAANKLDLADAEQKGWTNAQLDRLRLTPKTIAGMSDGSRAMAKQTDPIGETVEEVVRPNGLRIRKIRVPLGVVFFVYESRPNVTSDAAGVCLLSGNAVILRGGKEAFRSNQAIHAVLVDACARVGVPADAMQLVSTTNRVAVGHFLTLSEYIAVTIPRGGESLIRRVAAEARMPVIKHFDGNCHVYVDAAADLSMASRIVVNAKCQRMGVCNAAESLLVHSAIAHKFLPDLAKELAAQGVEIRGDERTRAIVPAAVPANEDDWSREYLGPILSSKIVDSLDEAIRHINRYGSKHTDAIVTANDQAAQEFARRVDSAAVMINASTRFHDGGEFGLGAEIGISTDKLHARGPCGARELTSYKYVVGGAGHTRG